MTPTRSETSLPPVRRTKRRRWGRLIARILCVLLAVVGVLPVGVGLLVRTSWARGIAERETRKVLDGYGIHARYDLELHLWPLSVGLRNLRVESTDGQGPILTARRATARPKIFGLLAGKLIIDEVEIVQPAARVVLEDGKLKNLDLHLPETKRSDGSQKPPFSVISTSEARVDLTIDGTHVVADEIDADVTTDDSDGGGTAYEVAVRAGSAKSKIVRQLDDGTYSVDEDLLCRIDGRARIEPRRVVVRRLSAFGAADLDPAEETGADCRIPKTDKRYVELSIGHFTYQAKSDKAPPTDLPGLDGHVHVRIPLKLIERVKPQPGFDGWATLDTELRIPAGPLDMSRIEATGHVDVTNIKIYKFEFARHVDLDFAVRRGLATTPKVHVEIANGIADIKDVEVTLRDHFATKASLDIRDVTFTKLLQDLKIHPHPHVTWDVNDLKVAKLEGTIVPLSLEGDMVSHTANFAVYDKPMDSTGPKQRMTGVKEGLLQGRLGIHPKALEFMNMTITGPHSVVRNLLVSIGYTELLNVQVRDAKIDLRDLSPLGSIPIAGLADLKATVTGAASDPHIAGEVLGIKDFSIGEKPNDISFGNMTGGRVHLEGLSVIVEEAKGQKNKSTYEMPTGRLEFGGEANMRLDGALVTKGFDVRDFLAVFHMDEDPRFDPIHAQLEANARIHLALGGPEDVCHGGFLDVQGITTAHQVELFGEKFDEAQADFEYRWTDRQAGIEGADIDVRSLSLSKVKKDGRTAIGNIIGSLSVQRGGALRGNLVMQGYPLSRIDLLGDAAAVLEGSASGVARLGGTVTAFTMEADVDVTPIRILGSPFGSSDLHVLFSQKADPVKVIGETFCKAKIVQAFDKEAYLRNLPTAVSGEIDLSGHLFGRQIALDDVKMVRKQKPVFSGKLAFDKFDLGPVARLFFASDEADAEVAHNALGGELTGAIDLKELDTSDMGHAQATFEPKTIRFVRGGQRLEWRAPPTRTIVALDDDRLLVPPMVFDLAATNGFKGAVGVTGSIEKVTHGAQLALTAELSPIDLGILVGVVPRLTRAGGSLAGKLKVAGSASAPSFDGQLRVRAGDFAFKGVPGGITDVDIDIEADENEARISRGVGHFLGGNVALTGRMPWSGGQLGTIEANLTGRQLFVVPTEGVKATVDADLTLTMSPQATTAQGKLPVVGGDVTITAFEYTKPIAFELNSLGRTTRTALADTYDPTADAVSLAFDVKSRVPLRFRNNIVDAQLALDPRGVRVTGTNQRFGLRGEATALSGGRFRVFANDFEIQKGSVRFDDPTRMVPHIDITAVTEYRRYSSTLSSSSGTNTTGSAAATSGSLSGGGGTGGSLWRITVHAYGDADNVKIDLSSDPPLSREDIVFLLTIGLTRAEVDQVQSSSVYSSALFETVGTLSGVDRAVKQAIPVIDDFRPGTAYSPRTGRVEPNITVGRRLTDTIRARLTSGLAEDPQLRSAIEWRLNRHFTIEPSYDRINTVSSSNIGNFGVDFRWSLEFD